MREPASRVPQPAIAAIASFRRRTRSSASLRPGSLASVTIGVRLRDDTYRGDTPRFLSSWSLTPSPQLLALWLFGWRDVVAFFIEPVFVELALQGEARDAQVLTSFRLVAFGTS